jgi:hypothetical protein
MEYLVHLTLVSEEVTENVPGEWVQNWDSHAEFMNNHYFSVGGSVVKLNPESEIDFGDSPFAGTEVDDSDDPAVLEEYGDGFHFISSETLDDGSVEITYRLCPQIEISVEANSEEEAKNLCNDQAYELFDIIDAAADEAIGTEMIEIQGVREA